MWPPGGPIAGKPSSGAALGLGSVAVRRAYSQPSQVVRSAAEARDLAGGGSWVG